MKNSTKFLLIGLTLGAAATLYMIKYSKQGLASYLVRKGKFKSKETLLTFGKDFLQAWVKAARQGVEVFNFQGKNYNTQGGKAVS